MQPPCYFATATEPAADHVSHAAAALAMAAMYFKDDAAFATTLLSASRTAFAHSRLSDDTAGEHFEVRPRLWPAAHTSRSAALLHAAPVVTMSLTCPTARATRLCDARVSVVQ